MLPESLPSGYTTLHPQQCRREPAALAVCILDSILCSGFQNSQFRWWCGDISRCSYVCTSPMTSDLEHSLMRLLTLCTSAFMKRLSHLSLILNWVQHLKKKLPSYRSSLCNLLTSLLSDTCFVNIFWQSMAYLFIFLMSFGKQKF